MNARIEWRPLAFPCSLGAVMWACLMLSLHACGTPAPAAAPGRITLGTQATYVAVSERQCVTIDSIATGPGSVPWAWATVNADPRRVVHVRAADLVAGCVP